MSAGDEILFLKLNTAFLVSFGVAYLFEFMTNMVAGYLILNYSGEATSRRDPTVDPVTGLEVPSLVFVYNQQQIIDCIAGVRTETPEQYNERIQEVNREYVEHYI